MGSVLPLCEWASSLSDAATVPSEGSTFDDDPDFRNLKFQVLHLVEAGLRVTGSDKNPGPSEATASSIETMLAAFAEHPRTYPRL